MLFTAVSKRCLALVLVLAAASGCDDGGSGGAGGTAGSGGSGGSGASGGGGSGGDTGSGGATGSTTSGSGTIDFTKCEGKFPGQDPACQECAQSKCAESLVACCAADGCAEVVTCAVESGCDGINCYTDNGMPGPCAAVIDMYGGPVGEGVAAAQDFGGCAQTSCMTECAPAP